ncbi:MAG: hypothetical protein A2W90_11670 [Bacteroidetes bacterium GWF2_42_66]|nr:MAG: hypothetical protein A2W89_22900 [Bacteroidetes bacterium GWE2_42_39]OFY44937.1 MAG: hypothetical protein A2W90_11670 [Bacteroidetes bacterium GWF2_42_66]HBL76067.1 hypothetical protein [Prolixibacteraceae bacterium]HCU62183.1 hypothetical protein [Prolixibacteraceae bacterium]
MANSSLERRTFLKMLGAGIGATLVPFPMAAMSSDTTNGFSLLNFRLGKPEWILHKDGTFDLIAGNIRLRKCRPSIDGQAVFARNTFMGDSPKGKRIIYELDNGYIMLDLKIHSGSVSIGAEISGVQTAPHLFCPIGEAEITGVESYFKQGLGSGGQSGVYSYPNPSSQNWGNQAGEQTWSYDSYMVSGLVASNGDTMAIGAYEHENFLQRSTFYSRSHRWGLKDRDPGHETYFFEAGYLTENIPLADDFLKLPDIYVFYGNQPFDTLQHLAWNISEQNVARRDTNTSYHWCSKYEFHKEFSYSHLLTELEALDKIDPKLPLQTLQIDDCYCVHGDWLDVNENWPEGLEVAARQIFQRRFQAGIWIAPFKVDENSKLFKHHKDWLNKNLNDELIIEEDGPQGKQYSLDPSHPEVQKYLRKVFRTYRRMGFIFFKIDYLDWGLKNAASVKRFVPGKTSVQAFIEVIRLIREEIGAGSFLLASRSPYAPMIGYVDAMRVSNDVEDGWTEGGVVNSLQESYYTQYLNNVLWQNDPDVLFLRNENIKLDKTERESLTLWNSILGGSISTSDRFSAWNDEQLLFWRFLQPQKRPQSAVFPYWPNLKSCKVAVRRYKKYKGWGLLIFNDSEQEISESFSINDVCGHNSSWVYLWNPGSSVGLGKLRDINLTLKKHEAKLLFLSDNNENPPEEMTLSGVEMSSENYFDV